MTSIFTKKNTTIIICSIALLSFISAIYGLLIYNSDRTIEENRTSYSIDNVNEDLDLDRNSKNQGWIIGSVRSKTQIKLSQIQICAYGTNPVLQTFKKCQKIKETGDFEIILDAGSYELVVTAKQHRSEKQLFNITPGLITDALFNLEFSDKNIQGVVYSASGETIIGAQVAIVKDGEIISEVTTDEKGKFQGWAPNGPVILTAKSPNYSQSEVFTSSPSHDVTIKLFPGFSVQGRVISKSKGIPLSDIKVVANKENSLLNDSSVFTTTDDNGEFLLQGLKPGESYLRVFDDVWTVEKSIVINEKDYNNKNITIVAEKGQALTGLLKIEPGAGSCSSGHTYLTSINSSADNNSSTRFLIQSKSGVVHFPALPMGSYTATSHCEEHILTKGPRVIDLNDTKEAEWYFESGLSLEVLVTNQAGQPIHNATINLVKSNDPTSENIESIGDGNPIYSAAAVTDEKGYHKFGGLLEGTYKIEAGPPGLNPIEMSERTLSLLDGEILDPVNLIIAGQGNILIVSQTEKNLPNSRTFFYAQNESGERFESLYLGDGKYSITPLPLGRYQVFAYDNKNPKITLKHNNEEFIFIENNQPIELSHIALGHAGEIKGTIYDHIGAFASDVEVRVVSEKLTGEDAFYSSIQEIMHGKQSSLTDQNGKFIFSGLVPNEAYQLFISSPEGIRINKAGIFPGEELNITLPQPQIFKGKVLLPNGTPSSRFTVQLIPESGQPIVEFFESSTGEFSLALGDIPSSALIRIIPESNTSYIEEEIQFGKTNNFKIYYLKNEK